MILIETETEFDQNHLYYLFRPHNFKYCWSNTLVCKQIHILLFLFFKLSTVRGAPELKKKCLLAWYAFKSKELTWAHTYHHSPIWIVLRSPPPVPTATPQNVAVHSSTASQLDVTWDPPPLDAQNGDIQGYKVWEERSFGVWKQYQVLDLLCTPLMKSNVLLKNTAPH